MPQVTLTVNGRAWTGEVPAGTSLLELLRGRDTHDDVAEPEAADGA